MFQKWYTAEIILPDKIVPACSVTNSSVHRNKCQYMTQSNDTTFAYFMNPFVLFTPKITTMQSNNVDQLRNKNKTSEQIQCEVFDRQQLFDLSQQSLIEKAIIRNNSFFEIPKRVFLKSLHRQHHESDIIREMKTSKRLLDHSIPQHQSSNVISPFLYWYDAEWITFVMDYNCGGDLHTYFSDISQTLKKTNKKWPKYLPNTHTYILQLCDALCFIHNKGIIHRDIKPENILISHTKQKVFIADFGLSYVSEYISDNKSTLCQDMMDSIFSKQLDFYCGSYSYMSPEMFEGKTYNASIDLYGLGLIMLMWLTGFFPQNMKPLAIKFAKNKKPPVYLLNLLIVRWSELYNMNCTEAFLTFKYRNTNRRVSDYNNIKSKNLI